MAEGTSVGMIGEPFACEERSLVDLLDGLGAYLAVVNDPPWSTLRAAGSG